MQPMPAVLETERLKLRWFREEDAALMFSIWNDADFQRFVGDRGIRTLEAAQEVLGQTLLGMAANLGYAPYRVSLKAADEPVGICGLFQRDFLDCPDIGYSILPEHRRRGFAREAGLAVVDAARASGVPRIAAIIARANTASRSLLGQLGTVREIQQRPEALSDHEALFEIKP